MRCGFRKALAAEFAALLAAAIADKHLPEQDTVLFGAAIVGLLVEGLIGPLAPGGAVREREIVQSLALVTLRGLGVTDARARGLAAQTPIPRQQSDGRFSIDPTRSATGVLNGFASVGGK